jgi:hypothetical protein
VGSAGVPATAFAEDESSYGWRVAGGLSYRCSMKLLVRVDRRGDVSSFRYATEGRRIDEIRLHNPWEAPWIRDALVQYEHPREASFFVVEAPSEESVREDVHLTSRNLQDPEDAPGFVVLATAH